MAKIPPINRNKVENNPERVENYPKHPVRYLSDYPFLSIDDIHAFDRTFYPMTVEGIDRMILRKFLTANRCDACGLHVCGSDIQAACHLGAFTIRHRHIKGSQSLTASLDRQHTVSNGSS